ncbi:hypothetical protein RB195_016080 [Necator americanus]|uniref:Uncharacterized protein n=1 Tax=Necator americanus TaxID=51031 RepID=A0ABR1E7I1_NECAM
MNISAFREIWKSSPEYTTRGSYHKCFRQNFTDKFVTQPGDDTDTETTVISTEESTSEKAQTTPLDQTRKDEKSTGNTGTTTEPEPINLFSTTEIHPDSLEGSNGRSLDEDDDSNIDFIIFVILSIVAAILLIAIIPILIGCLVIKSKRDRRRRTRKASAGSMAGKPPKRKGHRARKSGRR